MGWVKDVLPGYSQLELTLPGAKAEPGEASPPVATLIRRNEPKRERAVLLLHGWNDYFFQTHVADHWDEIGYDFYALDMRRYGRSLRPGQYAGFVKDLATHFAEIDLAMELLAVDHPEIVLVGHSTGGLVASLWADARPGRIKGLVLNSPWLASQGSYFYLLYARVATSLLARIRPAMVLPVKDEGAYAQSLHLNFHGEWNYDLALKRSPGGLVRAAWLRAIFAAQRRVARGLRIDVPILVLLSARGQDHHGPWSQEVMTLDSVMDVALVAQRVPGLGRHVTLVRLEAALHDVTLSAAPVRAAALEEIRLWESAYLR